MSLIIDIQHLLLDPTKRITDILRMSLVLAHKLKSEELRNWVDAELNGYYGDGVILPEYRKFGAESFGHFSGPFGSGLRDAPIPTASFPVEIHEYATRQHLPQSVGEIEAMLEKGEDAFKIHWPPDLVVVIAERVYENMVCLQAWKLVSSGQLVSVIETVKNRLLAFLLELEDLAGQLDGDNEFERGLRSEQVSHVFNTFIMGDNNVVGAGSNFNQKVFQNINHGDFGSLSTELSKLGIDDENITILKNAIEADGNRDQQEGLGGNVKSWIGKVLSKVADGAYDIAIELAPTLLIKAISAYYGWG